MENIGNLIPHRLGPIRTLWDQLWLSYGIFSDFTVHFLSFLSVFMYVFCPLFVLNWSNT